jgi:hypothetical protein
MAKFLIGVDIEQTRSTTIVVEVEADTLSEAERKAVEGAQQGCYRATDMKHLGIGPYHGWVNEGFAVLGTNHEENWGSGDYKADIRV